MARKVERQFRRTCIFCGTPAKMTDEHVWGDWVRKFLPHAANSHEQHSRTIAKDGQDRIALRKRAGNVLGATVPVVCKDCNSGWLSRIQTAGKRHLPALFAAKRHIITQESQKAIATWATMATITAEYTHQRVASIAVTQQERLAFKLSSAPLPGWRVWIGHFNRRRLDGYYYHAVMPIHHQGDLIVPNVVDDGDRSPLPNTQWSTIILGDVYIHVASSSTCQDWIEEWNWENETRARSYLVQIWPIRENIIVWPIPCFSDGEATRFASAQFRHIHKHYKVDVET